ncbi:transposase [Mycobacterium intracellulare]|uniref:transposase n=1 Tax=Mycobacterium intracellulare TaxID=1767 RepID=UPI0018AD4602
MTDLRNRGVTDTFFLICDGLKGLPDVVGEVWPATIVQACTVHLIRNSFRYVPRQHWTPCAAISNDLHRPTAAPQKRRSRRSPTAGQPISGPDPTVAVVLE